MVQLLQRAGVDFAILGEEETCTGDPARRMGEEFLYQQQAQTNIETHGPVQVQAACDDLRALLQHDQERVSTVWRQSRRDYEVIHHTEFLAQLVADGQAVPTEQVDERVAYHDPCYIGRYNDIYDEPRACCRASPASIWSRRPMESREGDVLRRRRRQCLDGGLGREEFNVIRLEQIQKASRTRWRWPAHSDMVMFEDAAKNTGVDETLARKDVAELLLQSLPPK